MIDNDAWTMEERLWCEGESAYRDLVHPGCIMVFVAPLGILQGSEIIESIRQSPRWDWIRMTEKCFAQPSDDVMVLAYRALANRRETEAYHAYCTSTYHACENEWKLVQHQQTPHAI
ncbi:hypothetical protein [Ensifer canadensis]